MWLKLFAGTQRNMVNLDQDLLVCVSKLTRLESISCPWSQAKAPWRMILNDTANFKWNRAQDMPSESMGEHIKKIVP